MAGCIPQDDEKKDEKKQVSFLSKTQLKKVAKKDPVEHLQKTTEEDLKIIKQLEDKYGDRLKGLNPYELLRFVRGYAHEKERFKATCVHLEKFLETHKKWNFPNILNETFDEENECLNAWQVFIYGEDQQGHPVFYDEIASSSPETLVKCFKSKEDKLKLFRYRLSARLAQCKQGLSEKYDNKIIYKHSMVMNMKGFSRHHFAAEYRNMVKNIVGSEQNLFPETLHKLYIVNAPFAFRIAWKIISNFVDPLTYKKISVFGGDFIKEMRKEIDDDQIPKTYGGSGKWEIRLGDVPKYRENS